VKDYFKLQYTLTLRKLKDVGGLDPFLSLALLLLIFAGSSFLLFLKTIFAPYIYVVVALLLILRLSEANRIDFLKSTFNRERFKIIRTVENVTIAFPFLVFLIFSQAVFATGILLICSVALGVFEFTTSISFTMPTPFYKRPFEFIVGFRRSVLYFVFAYGIACIAIYVNNFNLCLFALGVNFLLILGFYVKPENEFFVWSFAASPKLFLQKKIKIALGQATALSLPMLLLLSLFYPEHLLLITLVALLGLMYIVTFVVAKYGAFPNEMDLKEGILIALSISIPPLVLVVIPYFYIKAKKQLYKYLL
jgi:hypothetical protein